MHTTKSTTGTTGGGPVDWGGEAYLAVDKKVHAVQHLGREPVLEEPVEPPEALHLQHDAHDLAEHVGEHEDAHQEVDPEKDGVLRGRDVPVPDSGECCHGPVDGVDPVVVLCEVEQSRAPGCDADEVGDGPEEALDVGPDAEVDFDGRLQTGAAVMQRSCGDAAEDRRTQAACGRECAQVWVQQSRHAGLTE